MAKRGDVVLKLTAAVDLALADWLHAVAHRMEG